jgi:tetratricopeptide (TPR) repeat protein
MTETPFERYKEALRAGHVAVVRRRYEDAVAAYGEAITIAPDRALPRVALGGAFLRAGDAGAALEAFDVALAIIPDDDSALVGRAQALVVLRRTSEAAVAYDRLVEVRLAADREADALEAARRALAIEPADERRARHAGLAERLRDGDAAGTLPTGGDVPDDSGSLPDAEARGGGAGEESTGGPGAGSRAHDVPTPGPDPEELIAEAEAAAASGDREAAAAAALAAAREYRARGHVAAAFDACLLGIGARPADVDLHLFLSGLAADRGWTASAGEGYRNLLRLVELDGDASDVERVGAAAATRLPEDPRFTSR